MVKKVEGTQKPVVNAHKGKKTQAVAKEKIDPKTLRALFGKNINTRKLTGLDVSNGQTVIEEGSFAGLDSLGGLKFFSTQSKEEYITPENVKKAAAKGEEIRFNCE